LVAFKDSEPRYWVEGFLTAVGVQRIAESIGFEAFEGMLKRHLDRGNVSRKMCKLRRLRFALETARRLSNSAKTLADLYREVKHKVLAA